LGTVPIFRTPSGAIGHHAEHGRHGRRKYGCPLPECGSYLAADLMNALVACDRGTTYFLREIRLPLVPVCSLGNAGGPDKPQRLVQAFLRPPNSPEKRPKALVGSGTIKPQIKTMNTPVRGAGGPAWSRDFMPISGALGHAGCYNLAKAEGPRFGRGVVYLFHIPGSRWRLSSMVLNDEGLEEQEHA
jgi:hypothetical protein